MDLQTLKNKLTALDQIGKEIAKECGYTTLSNDLEYVKWDLQSPDEAFLHDELKSILNTLNYFHYQLSYLQQPITHEGNLQYNRKKGYELDGVQLHTDEQIEVLVLDEQTQKHKWKMHHLRENSSLVGMRARIRKYTRHRKERA